jgi:hypothetical protein
MNRLLILSVLAYAGSAVPANLAAQEDTIAGEGARVRISASELGEGVFVGEVVARSSDTLSVNYWEPIFRTWEAKELPISSINSLEVNRGSRSNAGKGAVLGGLIGGGFGLAAGIAAASYDCTADSWYWNGCWYWGGAEVIPLSTATFGLLGAGVGALIGALTRTDQWEPIPLDRLHVRISPTSGGMALAFSVGF